MFAGNSILWKLFPSIITSQFEERRKKYKSQLLFFDAFFFSNPIFQIRKYRNTNQNLMVENMRNIGFRRAPGTINNPHLDLIAESLTKRRNSEWTYPDGCTTWPPRYIFERSYYLSSRPVLHNKVTGWSYILWEPDLGQQEPETRETGF